jgi:hypothetical protein
MPRTEGEWREPFGLRPGILVRNERYIFDGCHTADNEAVTVGDRANRWALPGSGHTHT